MQVIGQAIRNRWLTDELKPLAVAAVQSGLESEDPKVKSEAVRNLLAMEAQNQRDEQRNEDNRLDEGRNRVLAWLAAFEPAEAPRLPDQPGEIVPCGGHQQSSPRKAARKNKRRKRR